MQVEATSEVLPWLMRQGAVLGYLAVALAAVVGALFGLLVRRIARGSSGRWALGRPRRTLAEGPGTFVGALQADEPIERFDDGRPCAVTSGWMAGTQALEHAAGLRLRMDDGTIAIEGPLEVVVAGDERRISADDVRVIERIARAAPVDDAMTDVVDLGGMVCSLRVGERVMARGTVVRRADIEAARDYRSAPERLVLGPGPGEAVQLASCEAHRGTSGVLRSLVLGGIVGLALGWIAGNRAFESIPAEGAAPASIPLSAQLATVSPLHHAPALDRLASLFVNGEGPWNRRRAEIALALGGERSCGQPLYDGIAALSDADFVDIALRCDARPLAVRRLVAAGEFERASALLLVEDVRAAERLFKRESNALRRRLAEEPERARPIMRMRAQADAHLMLRSGPRTLVHLLAGEPERAAATVRAQAEDRSMRGRPADADALRCLAVALERGASAEAELDARRRIADSRAVSTCATLHARSLADPDARMRALSAIAGGHLPPWIPILQAAHGHWPSQYYPAQQLVIWGLNPAEAPGAIGILTQGAERSPPSVDLAVPRGRLTSDWFGHAEQSLAPLLYYVAATSILANIHSLYGDVDTARSLIQELAPHVSRLERYVPHRHEPLAELAEPMPSTLRVMRVIEAFIELRAGNEAEAEQLLRGMDEAPGYLRRDVSVAWTAFERPRTRERLLSSWHPPAWLGPETRDALVEAMLGDLTPVTRLQEENRAAWSPAVEDTASSAGLSLMAIAIRGATTGRERLRANLDTSSPASGNLPDDLRILELHRQVAHAAGATDLEQRIRAAQDRYRERLRDPFTSLMWTIWSGL